MSHHNMISCHHKRFPRIIGLAHRAAFASTVTRSAMTFADDGPPCLPRSSQKASPGTPRDPRRLPGAFPQIPEGKFKETICLNPQRHLPNMFLFWSS